MNIMNVNTVIVIVIVVMMSKHTSILPLIETVGSVQCLKLFLFPHELICAPFPGVSHYLLYLSSIY